MSRGRNDEGDELIVCQLQGRTSRPDTLCWFSQCGMFTQTDKNIIDCRHYKGQACFAGGRTSAVIYEAAMARLLEEQVRRRQLPVKEHQSFVREHFFSQNIFVCKGKANILDYWTVIWTMVWTVMWTVKM